MRLHPSAVFYHTTRVYGAFTDLLVLRGRINKTWNKPFNTYGYIVVLSKHFADQVVHDEEDNNK